MYCKMADEKPGTVQSPTQDALAQFENSLLAMENLDRTSPEMWPEKIPGVASFISNYQNNYSTDKRPYSKELTQEDQVYLHQLAALPTAGLIAKVKELHDIAYQLGVEESKEVTRGKYLNIFTNRKDKWEKL